MGKIRVRFDSRIDVPVFEEFGIEKPIFYVSIQEGYPICFPVELTNDQAENIEIGKEYDVDFAVKLCFLTADRIYKDKEDFEQNRTNNMALESIIPCGAFPANENDKDFVPDAFSLINGIVDRVASSKETGLPEEYECFVLNLLGHQFDVVIAHKQGEEKYNIQAGNVICGLFYFIAAEISDIEKQ